MRNDDPLLHLNRRFNVVMALLLGLAAITTYSLVDHYLDVLHDNRLVAQFSEAKRLRANVDSVLSTMSRHVTRLQFVANDTLADLRQQARHDLPFELQPFYVNDTLAGYSLDALSHEGIPPKFGNILTDKKEFSHDEKDELTVMWRLFPLMRAMHASEPALLWSYYQPLRFIALNVYPFQFGRDEVANNGYTTFHDFITGYTTPQRIASIYTTFANSDAPAWRGAHLDGGGAGWIASVSTPVRYKNDLLAVVAADVALQFLTDTVQANVPPHLRAIILDDRDQLLADSNGLDVSHGPPQLDAQTQHLLKKRLANAQWQHLDGYSLLTQTLDAAPWHLVVIDTAPPVMSSTDNSVSTLVLLSVMFVAGLALLTLWLRYFYVSPALRLAQQLMSETRFDEKRYPRGWQPSARKLNEMRRERELLLTALHREQQELEARVAARTQALTQINKEMESFSYAVSHDLRGPLRAVNGFAHALREDCAAQLNEDGQHYIERICSSVLRMEELIDGLLQLSRVGGGELRYQTVDLSAIASSIVSQLREQEPERAVEIYIEPHITALGDERLLRSALENLLGNAWKYSSQKPKTSLQFGCEQRQNERVFFVADKGAGFDMQYAERLFVPFQRLHSAAQFAGTGVGLATVQRIINRHGGRIWVQAQVDVGATFYFTLP